MTKQKLENAAALLGRRGGLKGGKARAAAMTPEERARIARQGGLAKAAAAAKRARKRRQRRAA